MPTTDINNSPNANASVPGVSTPTGSVPQPAASAGEIPTVNPALLNTGLPTLGQSLLISTTPPPSVPTPAPAAPPTSVVPTAGSVVPPTPIMPTPAPAVTTPTPTAPPMMTPSMGATSMSPAASPATPTLRPVTTSTRPAGMTLPTMGAQSVAPAPTTAPAPRPQVAPMSAAPIAPSTPSPAPVSPASTPSIQPTTPATSPNSLRSASPVIPSVAPTAPGAEPKPVAPITEKPVAAPEKKTDLTMIILAVVLVILVVVAGVLWWMNANGKSLFGNPATPVVTPEPIATPVTTPEPVVDASAGGTREELVAIDPGDLCYVNPDALGQQKDVEEFVTWVNNYFTDDLENSEYYQNLFNYYQERAIMAPPLCDSHQLYCRVAFSERPDFVAQFSHFGEQWERQTTESKTLTGQSILDRALIDFNMPDLVLDENVGRGSKAGNGWKYNADQDLLLSFGDYTLPQQDYTYRFVKGMQLAATQEVVLIGQGVATQNCKEDNNCICEASQMYLYLQKGPTGELYYSNLFIEPLVGKTAEVDADL